MIEQSVGQERCEGDSITSSLWRYIYLILSCFCLASGTSEADMSSKKKMGRRSSGQQQPSKAKKLTRSISMSPERTPPDTCVRSSRRRTVTYKPKTSVDYIEQYFLEGIEEKHSTEIEDYFPFQSLPVDCKLKIFSFLSADDRMRAGQVCQEWHELIKTASLWNSVNLTSFALCNISKANHQCGSSCYQSYRQRMRKFMHFLESVRPVLRNFSFAYDIGDSEDAWLKDLEHLMQRGNFHDLEFANLNWKETPIKPFWEQHVTWSVNEYNELMYRHKRRQRVFVKFFELFTSVAPNVQKLILPFDWSPRSLSALSKLTKLNTLVLEKYFVFQTLNPSSLDQLFASCPNLKRLILEAWTPSGRGLAFYEAKSDSLEYFDVSQCRGFYLEEVNMPRLKVFKVARHPWNGPLTCRDQVPIKCIYQMLNEGTPELKQINEHVLKPNWNSCIYEELDIVLKSVCSCHKHKTGWVM